MNNKIIAVDFDGTLCENKWPDIGAPNEELFLYLKHQKCHGAKLILWTCRCGDKLSDAICWCNVRGLSFDAVNENIPEIVEEFGTESRKIFANEYIDDKMSAQFKLPYIASGDDPDPKETRGESGCEYCQTALGYERGRFYEIEPCSDGDLGVRAAYLKGGVVLFRDRVSASGYFDINFCPICGRKIDINDHDEIQADDREYNTVQLQMLYYFKGSTNSTLTLRERSDGMIDLVTDYGETIKTISCVSDLTWEIANLAYDLYA